MSTGSLSPNRVNVSTSMSLESCSHDMCQYLSEGQTQADHTAHCSGMLLGALTPGIGIELGKHWQSLGTPMLYQGVQGGLGCDGSHGPSRHKPTMPRDTGENLHLGPSCNDHTFDHINALELRVSVGDHGPIPAPWRWPTPLASASVEHPAASQDASHGPPGRERREAAGVQLTGDRHGALLPQLAVRLQRLAHLQHQVFQGRIRPSCPMRTRRWPAPIDPIEAMTCSPLHPTWHRRQAHTKPPCDCAHRQTPPHQDHHGATSFCPGAFWAMSYPPSATVFRQCPDIEVLTLG